MKLIINIPEKVKETFDKADDINFCFYDYNSVIGKAIRNGTPLDSVIKDMKKESAEPTGHWIEHYNPEAEICMQHMSECSVCGKMICGRYNIYKNFCPNCGEKMEEQKTT